MFERTEDYIVRVLVPFFVASLAQILHLKREKRNDEASALVQANAEKILGMDMNLILHMPYDHLMAVLRDDMPEGMVKCLILAELLNEKAEIYETENKTAESAVCYLKSFNIFYEILFVKDYTAILGYFSPAEIDNRFESMATVVEQLMLFEVSEDVLLKLMRYHEETGAFARAEDLLFEAIEIADDEQSIIDRGIAFFKRLLLKSDEELVAGNLPRSEVEAGLHELLEQTE